MIELTDLRGPALRDRLHAARAHAVEAMRASGDDDLRERIAIIDGEFSTAVRAAVAAYESVVVAPPAPEPEPEPATQFEADATIAGLTIPDPRLPPADPGESLVKAVEAARALAETIAAPLLFYGRQPVDLAERAKAWRLRGRDLYAATYRLKVLDGPANAKHPLLVEGLQLRARISTAAVEATVQERACSKS